MYTGLEYFPDCVVLYTSLLFCINVTVLHAYTFCRQLKTPSPCKTVCEMTSDRGQIIEGPCIKELEPSTLFYCGKGRIL